MRNLRVMIVLLALSVGVQCVSGEESPGATPVMVGLWTPAQLPSAEWDVAGVRLDLLYGSCRNLYGLDLGLVNFTQENEVGLNIGLVNRVDGKFTGLQLGVVKVADTASALQIGLYNGTDDLAGVRLGLINHTRIARGVQVGLINVIENNDLAFLPLVNFFF